MDEVICPEHVHGSNVVDGSELLGQTRVTVKKLRMAENSKVTSGKVHMINTEKRKQNGVCETCPRGPWHLPLGTCLSQQPAVQDHQTCMDSCYTFVIVAKMSTKKLLQYKMTGIVITWQQGQGLGPKPRGTPTPVQQRGKRYTACCQN